MTQQCGEPVLHFTWKLGIPSNIIKQRFISALINKLCSGIHCNKYPYHVVMLHSTLTAFAVKFLCWLQLYQWAFLSQCSSRYHILKSIGTNIHTALLTTFNCNRLYLKCKIILCNRVFAYFMHNNSQIWLYV
jgi:hypothetical protein